MFTILAIICICAAFGIINVAVWTMNRPSKEVIDTLAELDRQQAEIDTILSMPENTRYTKPGTTGRTDVSFTKYIVR